MHNQHTKKDVPLVEFNYLVFTRMPGESYRRRLGSLLYLCYVFRSLIHPIVLILEIVTVDGHNCSSSSDNNNDG